MSNFDNREFLSILAYIVPNIPTNLTHQEKILLAHIAGVSLKDILIENVEITSEQRALFQTQSKLLNQNYPLDYLLGEITIGELQISLTPDVLIPRPETEEWVTKIGAIISQNSQLDSLSYQERILEKDYSKPEIEFSAKSGLLVDVGCGSGIIGLSLSKYFRSTVLVDISAKSLDVAQHNAAANDIPNLSFFESNLLENPSLVEHVHEYSHNWYLFANLPYLPISDKANNTHSPLQYEPDIALYSGQFGTDLFQQLINQIKFFELKPRVVVFELDPRNIFIANQLLQRIYPHTVIWKDSNNLDRTLIGFI
jgi:release factor glutamine methyltransferase